MKRKFEIIGIILLVVAGLYIVFKIASENRFGKLSFDADCTYVYLIDDDKEIFSKNSDKKVYLASLTKMTTVYTALGKIEDFDKKAPTDKKSYQQLIAQDASVAGFYGNEPTIFEGLSYGMIPASAGGCADSLAINVSDSKEKLTDLMSENAKDMELNNTNFKNSEGMNEDDCYSSAEDMALLLKNSLKNEEFCKIFMTDKYASTKTLDHPKEIEIGSKVFSRLRDYEQGGFKISDSKNGTEEEAGLCQATLSEKNNKKHVTTVMGTDSDDTKNPGGGQI